MLNKIYVSIFTCMMTQTSTTCASVRSVHNFAIVLLIAFHFALYLCTAAAVTTEKSKKWHNISNWKKVEARGLPSDSRAEKRIHGEPE